MMQVELVNDGPVTLLLDSSDRKKAQKGSQKSTKENKRHKDIIE
jgi:hypothetical protein